MHPAAITAPLPLQYAGRRGSPLAFRSGTLLCPLISTIASGPVDGQLHPSAVSAPSSCTVRIACYGSSILTSGARARIRTNLKLSPRSSVMLLFITSTSTSSSASQQAFGPSSFATCSLCHSAVAICASRRPSPASRPARPFDEPSRASSELHMLHAVF